jgi:hypothetical protein
MHRASQLRSRASRRHWRGHRREQEIRRATDRRWCFARGALHFLQTPNKIAAEFSRNDAAVGKRRIRFSAAPSRRLRGIGSPESPTSLGSDRAAVGDQHPSHAELLHESKELR